MCPPVSTTIQPSSLLPSSHIRPLSPALPLSKALQVHQRTRRCLRHDNRHPKTQDIKTPSSLPRQLNALLPACKERRRPPPYLQHPIDLNIKHQVPNSSQHQLFPTHTKSALQQHHHHLGRIPKGKKKNMEPTNMITMSQGFSHGLVHCLNKAQAMRALVQSQSSSLHSDILRYPDFRKAC